MIESILNLLGLQKPAANQLHDLLDMFLIGAVITKDEDRRLKKVGFDKRMPAEFNDPEHEDYQNPWSRSKKCNIEWRDCRVSEHLNVKPSFDEVKMIFAVELNPALDKLARAKAEANGLTLGNDLPALVAQAVQEYE